MSQGVHNLFANPAFVGGLHQDPSSAAVSNTTFSPAITASESITASSYGAQCYNGTAANGAHTDQANCEAAGMDWRAGAYDSITLSGFPDNAAIGDKIIFAHTATAGNYVTSKKTTLTLTAYHTGASGAQTLTGTFDGPVSSGDTVVEHRTHYAQFVSIPVDPVVHRDEVIKLVAQTSYDADLHNYYGGGVSYRWVQSEDISPAGVDPSDVQTASPFGYPSVGGNPDIFQNTDSQNGKHRGSDPLRDVINTYNPSANTSVLELGPFGSMFRRQGNDIDKPARRGSYWWCDMLLLATVNNTPVISKVVQSPYFFLEVRD